MNGDCFAAARNDEGKIIIHQDPNTGPIYAKRLSEESPVDMFEGLWCFFGFVWGLYFE